MRIAILSTVYKTTPPKGYGGIERVVHILAEQLVKEGNEVILFATPGSHCSGKTIEIPAYDSSKAPSSIHSKSDIISEEPLYNTVSDFFKKERVDVIHDWSFQNLFVLRHPDKFPFIISTCIPPGPDYRRPNLVACSRAHAELCGKSTKYVYYGLDLDNWPFNLKKTEPFIHISKIARYKGQHIAIRAARKSGSRLVLAGNVADRMYYNLIIKPMLFLSPKIKYIGEIKGTNEYLQRASALIQTPRWFDAFPLVNLEAFASGTPVISLAAGGVPEQIVNGINGFLCNDADELANAMKNIGSVKPKDCRDYAEEHFSAKRMAKDYIELYKKALNGKNW